MRNSNYTNGGLSTGVDTVGGSGNNDHALFSIMADIAIKIGDLTKHVKDRDRIQAMATKYSQPSFYTNTDQATVITGGLAVVRLTGPDQGHVWYPMGLSFFTPGANGVETAMPGRAEVFISAADHRSKTALNQFSPGDWRDTIPNLPNLVHYSRSQLTLRFNEELYVVFTGGTVGLSYGACIWTLDYEEAAIREQWTL